MKRFLSSALLVFGGTCVALVLAEGLVRIFAPHSRDHVLPAGLFDFDSELGWKLHPGKQVRHHTPNYDVSYSINSMGFRDGPRTVARANGKRRILFFGDSQIFGWGVASDQSTSGLVEAHSPSTEVWNMALPGYGLDQEVLSYERDGQSLGATDVMFFVSRSTLERTQYSFIYNKHKPRFVVGSTGKLVLVPIRQKPSAWLGLVYRMLSPFYLPNFVEAQLTGRDGLRKRMRDPATPVSPAIVRMQMALLLKANAIAVERNQRMFVLAYLPAASRKELKDFCDRNSIVLVETPWPVAPAQHLFSKYDGHWRPRAHQLVAARLMAQLGGSGNGTTANPAMTK